MPSTPKEVFDKPGSGVINLPNSSLTPISDLNQNNYNMEKVESAYELMDNLENNTPLSLEAKTSEEDNVLKEESFNILLVRKEKKKNQFEKEKTISVEEGFLTLEESEREKVLKKIFKNIKKDQLVLRTPNGVLIRVQRNVTLIKKPISVQIHEERSIIESKVKSKEKRIDDLYSKLKKFLKKSKNNNN